MSGAVVMRRNVLATCSIATLFFEILLVGLEQRQTANAPAVEFAHHIAEGVERIVVPHSVERDRGSQPNADPLDRPCRVIASTVSRISRARISMGPPQASMRLLLTLCKN
jgi:hypothetical protein